ncbi:MAG: hypothetical protein E7514_02020 [Ruminococcaceae bacterium]|nr:hypothetical protein [Oscillospiraceae bacterium]
MFAVINVLKDERRFIKRIKNSVIKPKPELCRVNIKDAYPFYYLEICEKQLINDYSVIKQLFGSGIKFYICCNSYRLPSDFPYPEFKSNAFKEKLLINSSLDCIGGLNTKDMNLCVIDPKAQYTANTDDFIKNCKNLTVITYITQKYKMIKQDIFNKWGATVILKDSITGLEEYDCVISPSFLKNYLICNSMLLKNGRGETELYKGSKTDCPDYIKHLIPHSADKMQFLSALYEISGVKCLENCRFTDFRAIKTIKQ